MKVDDAGLKFLMQEEGVRNNAYPDPVTGGDPWTIGVGHTGPEVHPGLQWSDAQVMEALRSDITKAEDCINACVTVPLTQNQFNALASFTHNEGVNALPHGGAGGKPSHLLTLLNSGDYYGAACAFADWHIAGGVPHVLDGRRAREATLFLTEDAA